MQAYRVHSFLDVVWHDDASLNNLADIKDNLIERQADNIIQTKKLDDTALLHKVGSNITIYYIFLIPRKWLASTIILNCSDAEK